MLFRSSDLERLKDDLRRLPDDALSARTNLAARIDQVEREIQSVAARQPHNAAAERRRYQALVAGERRARLAYRRNVDDAYGGVTALRAILADTDALAGLRETLFGLRATVVTEQPGEAVARLRAAQSAIGKVAGAGHIRSKVSRARRALRGRNPDRAKAVGELDQALARYTAEIDWRSRARTALAPGLAAFDSAIAGTIGLRQQERLIAAQAQEIASCQARHRDISLSF